MTVLREEDQRLREERRKWVSLEVHNSAVKECQEAFEELKRNYKRETAEKERQVEELQKETVGLKSSLERMSSANIQLDTDVKLNAKMAHKFEELSLSLQEKVMSLAREKMEADQRAALLGKEVENVKVSYRFQFIVTAAAL